MHKILWITSQKKIKINKKNYNLISNKKLFVKKNISSNFNFNLGQKTIKELNQNKIFIDARLDLHGFVEVDAKSGSEFYAAPSFLGGAVLARAHRHQ